jgi:hypothetical protein
MIFDDWRRGDDDPLDDPREYDPSVVFCRNCGKRPVDREAVRCDDCARKRKPLAFEDDDTVIGPELEDVDRPKKAGR